ncbi:lipid droplet-associated hydrolase isoform 2-T2 [Leptodactylus fuscus]|uniref:lipid droplet-associated hydrolase isoform X2 n=1 Tax=Leptodactylus fuscus TaxID=238119 RepID=UPI003F4EBCDF
MRKMSEEDVPVHDEIIYCLGAATQVLKLGPWRDLQRTSDEAPPKVLFLIIPGNPGVIGFYKTFLQTLYCGFKRQYPVWAISHAGHCSPPMGMDMTNEHDHQIEDVFGLNGQIKHKLFFLKQNVPADVKLVLIGHSIGCYIILEMMKRSPELKVLKSILLFPTIERMAQSPQGKIMTPWLCNLRYVVYMPLYLLSFLPEVMKTFLVKLALRGIKAADETLVVASLNLFRMDCAANGMYMGSQEMVKVVERDNATIKKHLSQLIFYYGAADSWCPVQYYEDIRKDFPKGDIWLCDKGYRHAFVLDSSKEVATLVINWLKEHPNL